MFELLVNGKHVAHGETQEELEGRRRYIESNPTRLARLRQHLLGVDEEVDSGKGLPSRIVRRAFDGDLTWEVCEMD